MLEKLPPKYNGEEIDIERIDVLREVVKANRKLAELKGYSEIVPNKNIFINAVTLREAKESSEIENIVTTHDELFRAMSSTSYITETAKDAINCKNALWHGIKLIRQNSMLTTNMIVEIQSLIEGNNAGIRTQMGTVLMNDKTG